MWSWIKAFRLIVSLQVDMQIWRNQDKLMAQSTTIAADSRKGLTKGDRPKTLTKGDSPKGFKSHTGKAEESTSKKRYTMIFEMSESEHSEDGLPGSPLPVFVIPGMPPINVPVITSKKKSSSVKQEPETKPEPVQHPLLFFADELSARVSERHASGRIDTNDKSIPNDLKHCVDPEDENLVPFIKAWREEFEDLMESYRLGDIDLIGMGGISSKKWWMIEDLIEKHQKKGPGSLTPEEEEQIIEHTIIEFYTLKPTVDPSELYASDKATATPEQDPVKKGPYYNQAERHFTEWLDHHGYGWVYFDQTKKTYAKALWAILNAKRADVLVATDHGPILIDVKSRRLYPSGSFTLDEEKDIQKAKNFSEAFNLPTWFAISSESDSSTDFYWISLEDVLKLPIKKSGKSKEPLRWIDKDQCIKVSFEDTLEKVFHT